MLFDVRGYVRFSSPMFRQFTHQRDQLFSGGARLRLGQRRAQLGDDLVPHGNLNGGAGVLTHLPDQFRQLLSRLIDGEFHEAECTRAYKMMQREKDLGCYGFAVLWARWGWKH